MRQVGVIAMAMVLAAAALLMETGDGGTAVSAAPERLSREQLNLGVVAIDARIGDRRVRSSGAVIDGRAGLVVTSAHTVWGATSLRLTTGLGILHGRLVARAPCADLAVIEIQPRIPGLVALPAAAGGTPADSELLAAVGRREEGLGGLLTIPLRTAGTAARATFENGLPPLTRSDPAGRRCSARVLRRAAGERGRRAGGHGDGDDGRQRRAGRAGDPLGDRTGAARRAAGRQTADLRRLAFDYYRCAPQLHAYAQREHPGYRPADAVINAPVPATAAAGHADPGFAMSSTVAPAPQSMRDGSPWSSAPGRDRAPAGRAHRAGAGRAGARGLAAATDDAALRVARLPTDVAVEGDTVWVASGRDDRIVAIDVAQPEDPPRRHETGSAPLRVAVGAGSVWTANAGDDSVTRLNPLIPGSSGRRIAIGADAVDVAVGPDGAWVSNGQRGTVMRIDPISNRPLGPPIRTGNFPTALAIGATYLWVVNSGDGTIARVDPREDLVVGRRIPVGRDPQDIAVGFGSVWVANRGDGTVSRIDSATGRPAGRADRRRQGAGRPGRHPHRRAGARHRPRRGARDRSGLRARLARRCTWAASPPRSRSAAARPGWSTRAPAPSRASRASPHRAARQGLETGPTSEVSKARPTSGSSSRMPNSTSQAAHARSTSSRSSP